MPANSNLESARKKIIDSFTGRELVNDEVIKEAEKKHNNLWEKHIDDKNKLEEDFLDWNEEYLNKTISSFQSNFSKERFGNLQKVLDHLLENNQLGRSEIESKKSNDEINELSPVQSKKSVIDPKFHPSAHLKNASEKNDLILFRVTLRLELNNNRLNADDLRSVLAWAKREAPGLFLPYEENAFAREMNEAEPEAWTIEYYEAQTVFLETNYAEERFLHLIEVREKLRKERAEGFVPLEPNLERGPSREQQSEDGYKERFVGFMGECFVVIGEKIIRLGEYLHEKGERWGSRKSSGDKP